MKGKEITNAIFVKNSSHDQQLWRITSREDINDFLSLKQFHDIFEKFSVVLPSTEDSADSGKAVAPGWTGLGLWSSRTLSSCSSWSLSSPLRNFSNLAIRLSRSSSTLKKKIKLFEKI